MESLTKKKKFYFNIFNLYWFHSAPEFNIQHLLLRNSPVYISSFTYLLPGKGGVFNAQLIRLAQKRNLPSTELRCHAACYGRLRCLSCRPWLTHPVRLEGSECVSSQRKCPSHSIIVPWPAPRVPASCLAVWNHEASRWSKAIVYISCRWCFFGRSGILWQSSSCWQRDLPELRGSTSPSEV